jgi:hypothetical protein
MTIEAGIVIIINNIKRSESGWIGNGFFILFFYIYYFASFAFRAIVGIYDPFRNCISRALGTRPVCTFHQDLRRLAHTEKTYDLTHTYTTNIHLSAGRG